MAFGLFIIERMGGCNWARLDRRTEVETANSVISFPGIDENSMPGSFYAIALVSGNWVSICGIVFAQASAATHTQELGEVV